MDKRKFHLFLRDLKERMPNQASFLESIQDEFERRVEPMNEMERVALVTFPEQFIQRVQLDHPHWTTRLHEWAENGVPELLRINPIYLLHQNSYGDSVIMCFTKSACGAYSDTINYPLIRQLLSSNLTYDEKEIDPATGLDIVNKVDVLNAPDATGKSPLEYLIDFAYGVGTFEGTQPDDLLKEILINYANGIA